MRASLFASMHPLILVFYLRFTGNNVSTLEWLGTFTAFSGLLVAASSALSANSSGGFTLGKKEVLGDVLCFLAAAGEVVVIMNRHKIKQFVPLFQYSALTSMCVVIVTSCISCVSDWHSFHVFCFDDDCLLGWASLKWFKIMCVFGK